MHLAVNQTAPQPHALKMKLTYSRAKSKTGQVVKCMVGSAIIDVMLERRQSSAAGEREMRDAPIETCLYIRVFSEQIKNRLRR